MCNWIQEPNGTNLHYDAIYNRTCSSHVPSTGKTISLESVHFWGKPIWKGHYWPNGGLKYPDYFYNSVPKNVFYMHIANNAVIINSGEIFTNDMKLAPFGCNPNLDPIPPRDYGNSPIYDEVFIISQHWGNTYFHKMLEDLPRLAPYLEFLQNNTQIRIHVQDLNCHTMDIIEFIGLDPSRLVMGTIRAKIVYLPQATPCGFPNVQETQILSQIFREKLVHLHGKQKQNYIIYIQRTFSRQMVRRLQIWSLLINLAKEYNLTFEIFPDFPSQPLIDTMIMFNKAKLIVAPHGAGLSNIIYSEPGTYIIEGICNRPHVNLCYQRAAHILGHHYHAIPSRNPVGCEIVIDIDEVEIERVARVYLKLGANNLDS